MRWGVVGVERNMQGSRSRLVDQALLHRGLIVLESPLGFDADGFRTAFLAAASERGLGIAALDDPDATESNLAPDLAFIEAPLHAGLRGWRDTVLERHRSGRSTAVLLPTGVSGDVLAEEPLPTLLVDGHRLRLDPADVLAMADAADLPLTEGVAELIIGLGGGWPAWAHACLHAIETDGVAGAIETITAAPFRRRTVRAHLHRFTERQRFLLAQLAHFGSFSDAAAVAVGGLGFAETVLAHAPGVHRDPSGLFRFVTPVEVELTSEFELDAHTAQAIAPVLIADGQLLPACQILIAGGLSDIAAGLLESLPGRVVDLCNQRELVAVLRVLQPLVHRFPGLALKQARAHGNLAEIQASVESCQQVIVDTSTPELLRLEASIELLLYRHRTIGQDEAAVEIAALRESAELAGGPLPTRLREIEAQIMGQAPDNRTVQAAADRFVEVAAEWEFQQERLRAAKTLRGLAAGPLYHLGQYRQAQERLAHAAQLAISQAFDYGVTMMFKSRFDALCGDLDAFDRSIGQAHVVIAESGIAWLDGHLQWATAHAAGWRQSLVGVDRAYRNARHMLGPIYEGDSGVVLNAEMAVVFAMLGDNERARRCLLEVESRSDQNPMEYAFAEVIVTARSGDLDGALRRWRVLDAGDSVPADRRWRIELELLSAGWTGDGVPTVDEVEAEARRLGLGSLLPRIAPERFSGPGTGVPGVSITTFGRFAVSRAGVGDTPMSAQVGDLVKLLVVHDGRMTVEQVCDCLWPDADQRVGLRRLKNLLAKARNSLGHDALVRGPDTLSFGDGVATDLADFIRATNDSLARRRVDPLGSRRAAIAALDLYQGHLLPDDLYHDSVNRRRLEIRAHANELLDYLSVGDSPHAPWMASTRTRVLAADPAAV